MYDIQLNERNIELRIQTPRPNRSLCSLYNKNYSQTNAPRVQALLRFVIVENNDKQISRFLK